MNANVAPIVVRINPKPKTSDIGVPPVDGNAPGTCGETTTVDTVEVGTPAGGVVTGISVTTGVGVGVGVGFGIYDGTGVAVGTGVGVAVGAGVGVGVF
jgi:hypothetical protein